MPQLTVGKENSGDITLYYNDWGTRVQLDAVDVTLSQEEIARLNAASAIPMGTPREQISRFRSRHRRRQARAIGSAIDSGRVSKQSRPALKEITNGDKAN
jgi:hypothetical protein